jgi:hypothetical protein
MASWDTPAVAAPSAANYAAPLVDFSKINPVDDYFKGRQEVREEDKANLFRNGIPKDAGGNIDIPAITDRAARVGGIDYAMPLINLQMGSQFGNAAAGTLTGQPGAPTGGVQPPAQPGSQPMPSQPRSAPPQATTHGSSSGLNSANSDNNGQDTIRSLATEWSGGKDAMPAIGTAVRTLRINPDAPLTPDQVAKVKSFFSNAVQPSGSADTAAPPQPAAPPQATPASRIAQGFDAARPSSGQADAAPVNPLSAQADSLDAQATSIRANAVRAAAVGQKGISDSLSKEADVRADKAKQLRDQAADAPAIKEWRQSGSKLPYDEWVASAEGSKETAKEDAKLSATKYATLVENGTKAQTEIPQLELLQEQMNNDPNFFSGSGEKYNLLYKRLKSAVGIDPDAPVPQELLRKVTASNVLSSLGALKGLGPIRVAEMNMAREAAASPDNSIPANKMLVEISKRTHQRNAEIADMAQAYKDQNGTLDPGFDKKVTQYYKDHPMFSDPEIKDWHRIIGEQPKATVPAGQPAQPSQMPTFASPGAVKAAIASGQLQKGAHFTDANGVLRQVP